MMTMPERIVMTGGKADGRLIHGVMIWARLFGFGRLCEFQDEPVAFANRRILVPVLIF